jgi:radical SAM protein with 4Fe4S-binding SPASM domain
MRLRPGSFLPSTAVIELTYRCNHKCLFCSCPWFSEENEFSILKELDTGEWKSILDELSECGISGLAFTGGEALLRDDCLELLEYASDLIVTKTETVDGELTTGKVSPEIYLLSNGFPVTETILEFLAGKNIRLSLSLPGLSTFEVHTGFDHADHVLKLFARATEMGIPTTVNSTVTALNIHELKETLSAAFLAGAGQLLMNRFLPGGRGLQNSGKLSLNEEQVLEMLSIADDVLTRAGRYGNLGTEIPLCILNKIELKTLEAGTRCSAALGFFVIGPSGYVRVCNHSEVRLEHFREWRKLKSNAYWEAFRLRKYLPSECRGCSDMLNCDGGCREAAHITGGKINSKDPLL